MVDLYSYSIVPAGSIFVSVVHQSFYLYTKNPAYAGFFVSFSQAEPSIRSFLNPKRQSWQPGQQTLINHPTIEPLASGIRCKVWILKLNRRIFHLVLQANSKPVFHQTLS